MSVRLHFDRALEEGWVPYFRAAAARYEVRVEVLIAVASRESDMGGPVLPDGSFKWLVMPGDGGHGFGLMQVDKRSYDTWIDTGAWQHAEAGIHMGASVLASKREGIVRRAGRIVEVVDSKTKSRYWFRMPATDDPALLERVAIAAYNAGDWSPYHWSKGRSPDFGTTGKNYASDVLKRADQFRQWLSSVSPEGTAA